MNKEMKNNMNGHRRLKEMNKFITLLLLILSCGKMDSTIYGIADKKITQYKYPEIKHPKRYTDLEFIPFILQFERELNVGINYPVYFTNISDNKAGYCYTYVDGYKEVVIDKKYWEESDYFTRENLMYHEFGHCSLYLDHNNSRDFAGCPISIMLDKLFEDIEIEWCYLPHRNYYINQLRYL